MKVKESKNLVALKAIHDIREIQYQMQRDQNKVLQQNKEFFEKKFQDINLEAFTSKVQEQINADLGGIKSFYQAGLEYKGTGFIPYGIKFNKMNEILTLVSNETTSNENFLSDLTQGKMPKDFDNKIETGQLPNLGAGKFWGSPKSTILSAGALIVNMLMHGKSSLDETVNLQDSSITHSFPLPQDYNCENIKSSYLYESKDTMNFSFIHSGYSFGGSRGDTKKFAPKDCGTFIESSCLTYNLAPECTATTADLLCVYHTHTKPNHPAIPNKWIGHANLVKLFSVNKNTEDVTGSIFLDRQFNEKNPESTSLGTSGHTAVILGHNNEREYVTIGANRDIPNNLEGCGLQNFSIADTRENLRIFVLDPTEIVTSQKEFSVFTDIEYNNLTDLTSVVQYFDKELIGTTEEVN